jgi:quercetin dioxygenase-like cupin family protein
MTYFIDYREHTGFNPIKFFKTTFFESPNLMLGLNCLDPGQTQAMHTHADQDKFYFVLEGEGSFVVGEESQTVGEGFAVWAPAGVEHGVSNNGTDILVLLVGIAPAPG